VRPFQGRFDIGRVTPGGAALTRGYLLCEPFGFLGVFVEAAGEEDSFRRVVSDGVGSEVKRPSALGSYSKKGQVK